MNTEPKGVITPVDPTKVTSPAEAQEVAQAVMNAAVADKGVAVPAKKARTKKPVFPPPSPVALTEADAKADLEGKPRPDFPKNMAAHEAKKAKGVRPAVKARFNRVVKRIEKNALAKVEKAAVKKHKAAAPLPPPPVKRSRGRPEVSPWFDFDKHNPYYLGPYDVRLRAFPTFIGRATWNGVAFRCEGVLLKKADIAAWRGRTQP